MKTCAEPGCPALTEGARCHLHQPEAWHKPHSRRRTVTARQRKRILERDNRVCHVCGTPGATIIDHLIPEAFGGTDNDDNLAPIHRHPCHDEKTKAEAAWGRRNPR